MTNPPHSSAAPSDRLELMQTFVRIVEAGSLSAAAAQMLTTQPTVSRRLQALERALGVRLLQRSTHAMKPTEDGERCYTRAKELLADWAKARGSFVKVFPHEYRRALKELEATRLKEAA